GSRPTVLLVVLHSEEAQLAHARPDGTRDLSRLLPLFDVRLHFLFHEGAHGLPEHVVLLAEDLHRVSPHWPLTASRSTAPSALGRAAGGGPPAPPRGGGPSPGTPPGAGRWTGPTPGPPMPPPSPPRGAPPATSTTALIASPHRVSGMPYTQTPLTPAICMMTV